MWNSVVSSFSNGMGLLRIQLWGMALGVVIFLIFAIVMTNYHNSWIYVIGANVLALLPYCIFQAIYNRKLLKKGLLQQKKIVST